MKSKDTSCCIELVRQYDVNCASSRSFHKVPSPMKLGPLDHVGSKFCPFYVVFVYAAADQARGETPSIPIERLLMAMSYLLDHYPHLTGRLHIDATTGTRSINRIGSGACLCAARWAARLDSLPALPSSRITLGDLPCHGDGLVPVVSLTDAILGDVHLLSVQHTRFSCGAVALGFRVLHAVLDADAFFHLTRDLAEIYRASDGRLASPPCLRPCLFDEPDDDMSPDASKEALKPNPELWCLRSKRTRPKPPDDHLPLPTVERVIRWSGPQLAALKSAAVGHDSDGDGWVSTFDALSALISTRVYRARALLKKEQDRLASTSPAVDGADANFDQSLPALASGNFIASVNCRARLALPPHYPFNAVLICCGSIPHDTLAARDLESSLRPAAAAIHALTRSISPANARATARWIAAQPDKRKVKFKADHSSYGVTVITAWNKFDCYGTIFDVREPGIDATPLLVAPPYGHSTPKDGSACILPTERHGEPDVDLYLTLSEPVWDVLEADPVWMRFRQ